MQSHDPQYRTDDGSALRVYRDTVQNNYLSEQEGRPIFDEAIFVEVISPGSRGSTPVFEVKRFYAKEANREPKVNEANYAKWRKFIDDFETSENNPELSGTPLSEWAEISRSMAATLQASGVFTVDALAALPDNKLAIVGPDGRQWRDKASTFLEAAKDSAVATRLAAENERLLAEIKSRDDTIADLAARITAIEAGKGEVKTTNAKAAKADAAPDII